MLLKTTKLCGMPTVSTVSRNGNLLHGLHLIMSFFLIVFCVKILSKLVRRQAANVLLLKCML